MAVDNIGQLIREIILKNGMSISEFSRRVGTSRENVYSIFKRASIDTALLAKIGEVLDHDFFLYYTPIGEELRKIKEDIDAIKSALTQLNLSGDREDQLI